MIRPWVLWCINHRMTWPLFVFTVLVQFPLYLLSGIVAVVWDVCADTRSAWREIKYHSRTRKP